MEQQRLSLYTINMKYIHNQAVGGLLLTGSERNATIIFRR